MDCYQVFFSGEASFDLDALYLYAAERSSFEIADDYLARFEDLCRSLSVHPHGGAEIPNRTDGLRTLGFERRATILFRVGEKRVDILRVLYGGTGIAARI